MIFSMWDLGGSEDARSFWRLYYPDTQAIIFVIDSSDIERMDEAREDLHRMLTEHELWDAPLLVVANKQDEPRAATTREITEYLQLFSLSSRNWYIINTKVCTHEHGRLLAARSRWRSGGLAPFVTRPQRHSITTTDNNNTNTFRMLQATHPDGAEANVQAGLDWLVEVLLMPASKRQEKAKTDHRTMIKHAIAIS